MDRLPNKCHFRCHLSFVLLFWVEQILSIRFGVESRMLPPASIEYKTLHFLLGHLDNAFQQALPEWQLLCTGSEPVQNQSSTISPPSTWFRAVLQLVVYSFYLGPLDQAIAELLSQNLTKPVFISRMWKSLCRDWSLQIINRFISSTPSFQTHF